MSLDSKFLGERVKAARLRLRLTLSDLSKLTGISISYLSIIERGNAHHLNSKKIDALSKALNVPFTQLSNISLKKIDEDKKKKKDRSFGELIAERRWLNGLSQPELSRLSGVSPGYISQIENKSLIPHIKTAKKLASVLNINDKELLRYIDQDISGTNQDVLLVDVTGLEKEDIKFIEEQIRYLKRRSKRNN